MPGVSDAGTLAGEASADEREAAVRDVIQTIAQTAFDLDAVLQTVIDRAVRLCRADNGNIARRSGDTDEYRVTAFTSMLPEYERLVRERVYRPERGTILGRAILEQRVVHIVDVLEDPDYALPDLQKIGGYRSALSVPMMREGVPIGAIAVARNVVRPFSDAEVRLIETFADFVVIAVENVRLFQTVKRQRTELARFAPQVADLLTSDEGEQLLAGHRREITALFCDLRGFTAFAETAEPEEVFRVLREYHTVAGEAVAANGGTIEHFAGDGVLTVFNVEGNQPDHARRAASAATEILMVTQGLADAHPGWPIFRIGINTGPAVVGVIGTANRRSFAAIGDPVNTGARLQTAADPGQVVVGRLTWEQLGDPAAGESLGAIRVKGKREPVEAWRLHLPPR
jgi:class 3 adenylate cyclase/transposase-like protein